ncbi:MAG TPA: hypothetical protein PK767_01640 [Clostridiales bacterium]|nr:hypothetical protein [Clostridiales bacterium]HPP34930.1 hypothetical protein [Clostridiales bacterium]
MDVEIRAVYDELEERGREGAAIREAKLDWGFNMIKMLVAGDTLKHNERG